MVTIVSLITQNRKTSNPNFGSPMLVLITSASFLARCKPMLIVTDDVRAVILAVCRAQPINMASLFEFEERAHTDHELPKWGAPETRVLNLGQR